MKYRDLGATGLNVSEIALGTVEFGLDYGFRGSAHYRKPDEQESIRTIHAALDHGINLIDTARSYGTAEETVGRALAQVSQMPYLASKLSIPKDALAANDFEAVRTAVAESIEASLKALRVDCLDLLQIHNTSTQILESPEVLDLLSNLKKEGKVRHLGASTYGEALPLMAISTGRFQAIQVPFNMLDQSMRKSVLGTAAGQDIGILVRSAFMRGVLTPQVNSLPERLAPLRDAALGALTLIGTEVESLSEAALRYCLSFREVSTVIVGVRSVQEIEVNIASASRGPLPQVIVEQLNRFAVEDESLASTTNWADLI